MPSRDFPLGVARIIRVMFGTATVVSALIGLAVRSDPRWFAASAAFAALWWGWDLLVGHVLTPLGEWARQQFGGGGMGPPPNVRPTLEDTIRLLESHLERPTSRQVDINAAIRLEEIYRTVKKDPVRARDVIRRVKERYPGAPELRQYG